MNRAKLQEAILAIHAGVLRSTQVHLEPQAEEEVQRAVEAALESVGEGGTLSSWVSFICHGAESHLVEAEGKAPGVTRMAGIVL